MKDKKERGGPPVKAKPSPTTNPKASRSEDSMPKVLTIQGAISFLEKRGFIVIPKSDIAHVPVKYLAFESRLK